jgi:hypothetical protein
MTPQEKAKELVDKYYKLAESIEWTDKQTSEKAKKFNDELGTDVLKYWNELSKQSALIAVDEIMRFPKKLLYTMNIYRFRILDEMDVSNWIDDEDSIIVDKMTALEYWNKVKQEIEKL